MKKYIIKYILDFLVIVLGISVSFWVNKIQNNKENKINEIHVYEDITMELNELTEMINERTDKFTFDLGLVNKVLNESLDAKCNYIDLLVAVTDYRGFEPKIEIYSSLKYDGGLKYISNTEIKVAINRFYSTNHIIYLNMEDEIVVQREILKHLHTNYPLVLINSDSKELDDIYKINYLQNIITNDLTLRSLLKSKQRFMSMKLRGIDEYKFLHQELSNLIEKALSN
tara:strand:- start:57 stop:737 length:681 start_codon:yes stop_codon:yes gene_type:complete